MKTILTITEQEVLTLESVANRLAKLNEEWKNLAESYIRGVISVAEGDLRCVLGSAAKEAHKSSFNSPDSGDATQIAQSDSETQPCAPNAQQIASQETPTPEISIDYQKQKQLSDRIRTLNKHIADTLQQKPVKLTNERGRQLNRWLKHGEETVHSVVRIFAEWARLFGKDNAKLTDERVNLIVKCLRTYEEQELLDCVRGYTHSAHHQGLNENNTKYTNLELFFRDAGKIEQGWSHLRTHQAAQSNNYPAQVKRSYAEQRERESLEFFADLYGVKPPSNGYDAIELQATDYQIIDNEIPLSQGLDEQTTAH